MSSGDDKGNRDKSWEEARHELARNLARDMQGKRPRVRIPPPPPAPGGGLFSEPTTDADWQAWRDRWLDEIRKRAAHAITKLAKERGADPAELAKVADLLIDYQPPERRGKAGHDGVKILGKVALYMAQGKSQQTACDLVGVSRDTFRKYRDADPRVWEMLKHLAELEQHPLVKAESRRSDSAKGSTLGEILDTPEPFPWPPFGRWPPSGE